MKDKQNAKEVHSQILFQNNAISHKNVWEKILTRLLTFFTKRREWLSGSYLLSTPCNFWIQNCFKKRRLILAENTVFKCILTLYFAYEESLISFGFTIDAFFSRIGMKPFCIFFLSLFVVSSMWSFHLNITARRIPIPYCCQWAIGHLWKYSLKYGFFSTSCACIDTDMIWNDPC